MTLNGVVHVAVQDCQRCETRRNPLNGEIVRKARGSDCNQLPDVEVRDWSRQLVLVRQDLDHLEADGQRVDREWGAKRTRPAQLPLPYKD